VSIAQYFGGMARVHPFTGSRLAPWAAGVLAERFGVPLPFSLAAVAVLLAVGVLATGHRRRAHRADRQAGARRVAALLRHPPVTHQGPGDRAGRRTSRRLLRHGASCGSRAERDGGAGSRWWRGVATVARRRRPDARTARPLQGTGRSPSRVCQLVALVRTVPAAS